MTEIHFAQANPIEGEELALASPDLFIMRVEELWGKFPVELCKTDIGRLEGMAVCMERAGIRQLIRAINLLGVVKIWAEYPEAENENQGNDKT